MKLILGVSLLLTLVSIETMAAPWGRGGGGDRDRDRDNYGRRPQYQAVSVHAQSFYPDQMTAQAVCRLNRAGDVITFTQFRQAGDRIDGKRSVDGRPNFQPITWGGGMSLDVVTCSGNDNGGGHGGGGFQPEQPTAISVSRQLYYPDQLTAQAICVLNGYHREAGFTPEKVAGDKIDGKRSFDGRPNFLPNTWHGGNDIETVFCK